MRAQTPAATQCRSIRPTSSCVTAIEAQLEPNRNKREHLRRTRARCCNERAVCTGWRRSDRSRKCVSAYRQVRHTCSLPTHGCMKTDESSCHVRCAAADPCSLYRWSSSKRTRWNGGSKRYSDRRATLPQDILYLAPGQRSARTTLRHGATARRQFRRRTHHLRHHRYHGGGRDGLTMQFAARETLMKWMQRCGN